MWFFSRLRAVAAVRRHLENTAQRIDARRGTVLRESRSGNGGLAGPPALRMVTSRPGDAGTVLADAVDAAVAAGYPRPRPGSRGIGDGCSFPSRTGFPELYIGVIPAGEQFLSTGEVLPPEHTGVITVLHQSVS